jgi:hypothetical protein
VCLIWALRHERPRLLLALGGVVALAVALRLVYPHQYPWGYHEDEIKVAYGALTFYCRERLLGSLQNHLQAGLYTAIIGPVYEWLGVWWAARWYSLLGSTLSVALGYGVARQLGFSVAAAMAGVAIPYAVLPWAILSGRTGLGGEVTLNALVVVLALIMCAKARGYELALAAAMLCFGLLLCCFEYTAGKILLIAAPAALLTFPRDRWWSRAFAVIAACAITVAIYASLSRGRLAWYGFDVSALPEHTRPLAMWSVNLGPLLTVLWKPLLSPQVSQSIDAAYVLPIPVVLLVGIGILFGKPRRTIALLLLLMVVGALPGLLGPGGLSSHRLLAAGYVVPFFIAAAIDRIPAGTLRSMTAAVVAAALLYWGPRTYFSDSFWTSYARLQYCAADCSLAAPDSIRAKPPAWDNRPVPSSCRELFAAITGSAS